jgi:hypothetical protein
MRTSTLRQAAGCGKSIQTLHGVVHSASLIRLLARLRSAPFLRR